MPTSEYGLQLRLPIGVLAPSARHGRHQGYEHVAYNTSSPHMQSGQQKMAICDETGLIAVANGRVVELYQADGITVSGLHTQDNNTQLAQPDANHLHLPFAGQIVLSDLIYGLEDSSTYVTSLYFPAPDVLFVASTTIQDAHSSSAAKPPSASTRLSGFRLYSRRVGAESRRATSYRPEKPFTIFLLFSDTFTGVAPIATMEPVPRSVFVRSDRGAVLVLFDQDEEETPVRASSLGVFQWSERYSDRELSVSTPLQVKAYALTTVAMSEDAQWVTIGDAGGSLSVLDFRRFVWDPEMEDHVPQGIQGGRRLPLGLRFRMGHAIPQGSIAVTRHPLNDVRVACQTRVGAANGIATALRWWTFKPDGHSSRTARYLLVGQQDGALTVMALVSGREEHRATFTLKTTEIYPPLRALKNDAVVFITRPTRDLISDAFSYSVVSTSSLRQWMIKQSGRDDGGKLRVAWPSLSDSLGLPTCQFERKENYGVVVARVSDRVAVRLTDALAKQLSSPRQLQWVLLLGGNGVRAIAHEVNELHELHNVKASGAPKSEDCVVEEMGKDPWRQAQPENVSIPTRTQPERLTHVSTKVRQGGYNSETQPHQVSASPEATQQGSVEETPVQSSDEVGKAKTGSTNPYNLPPMAAASHQAMVEPHLEDGSRPLTKDQYNRRLATMARRVETMSTSLHSLRRSFQLFTDDVKDHMAFVSMQLEQVQERVENEPHST